MWGDIWAAVADFIRYVFVPCEELGIMETTPLQLELVTGNPTHAPRRCYAARRRGRWAVVDNRTLEAWTEEFPMLWQAKAWVDRNG